VPAGLPKRRTARDRVRAELTREIKEAARRQLLESGPAGLSLRAVARELDMASSAVYRYFPSRDALLTALIVDSYDSLGNAAETAERRIDRADLSGRWLAICRAVRGWAIASPHEYALIYGSPVPGYAAPPDTIGPASRVADLLIGLLVDLGRAGAYPRPEGFDVPKPVHVALAPVRAVIPAEVPDNLLVQGLMAWTHVFGAVSFELFGQRQNVIGDYAVFFDYEMVRVGAGLGL
jgi:AcrR family transcriptional regulator